MLIHLLYTITGNDHIRVFHHDMFHGKCVDEYPDLPWSEAKSIVQPVRLAVNVWRAPGFFRPEVPVLSIRHPFVVHAEVKALLASTMNIAFRPVVFAKMICFPYEVDDFSYYESDWFQRVEPVQPEALFDSLPDISQPDQKQLASYYIPPDLPNILQRFAGCSELIVPHLYDISKSVQDPRFTRVKLPWVPYTSGLIPCSHCVVEEYPIIDKGYLILNDPVFQVLKPFIDFDYFDHLEFTI